MYILTFYISVFVHFRWSSEEESSKMFREEIAHHPTVALKICLENAKSKNYVFFMPLGSKKAHSQVSQILKILMEGSNFSKISGIADWQNQLRHITEWQTSAENPR